MYSTIKVLSVLMISGVDDSIFSALEAKPSIILPSLSARYAIRYEDSSWPCTVKMRSERGRNLTLERFQSLRGVVEGMFW